jgi:predicted Zn-dependent peptidase
VKSGWNLDVSSPPVARRSGVPASIEQGSPLVISSRPTEQANLLIGVPGLTASDDRRSTLSILNSVLGGGMSSRLFQEVREKRGLAYSVYSFGAGYSDAGVFGLYAGCSPAKAGVVAELMKAELERIASDGVTSEELRRAIGQLSGASALALEDSDTRMSRLGRSEITLGEFSDLDENLRRLHLVSVGDVQALAADLAGRPSTIAVVGSVSEDAFASLVA